MLQKDKNALILIEDEPLVKSSFSSLIKRGRQAGVITSRKENQRGSFESQLQTDTSLSPMGKTAYEIHLCVCRERLCIAISYPQFTLL